MKYSTYYVMITSSLSRRVILAGDADVFYNAPNRNFRGVSLMKRIEFKYHPNLYSDEILIHEEGICNCCGKKVSEYIGMAYSPEETDEQIMRKEL